MYYFTNNALQGTIYKHKLHHHEITSIVRLIIYMGIIVILTRLKHEAQ